MGVCVWLVVVVFDMYLCGVRLCDVVDGDGEGLVVA